MSPSENTARQAVALLDAPQDAIDDATRLRLKRDGFRVVTVTDLDPAESIDVAVIRSRAAVSGDADVAVAVEAASRQTRAAVGAMSHGRGGRIIHVVSSIGRYRSAWFRGSRESGSQVSQAIVEGALIGQTRQLAFELARHRIRVNAVAHGWIRGIAPEPDRTLSKREKEALLTEISLRRPGEPDEVAAVIAFLAGPASSYITGTVLDVNGGWWMS
jgi:3-oxoacyl-[acyl-carrier protein] reductase